MTDFLFGNKSNIITERNRIANGGAGQLAHEHLNAQRHVGSLVGRVVGYEQAHLVRISLVVGGAAGLFNIAQGPLGYYATEAQAQHLIRLVADLVVIDPLDNRFQQVGVALNVIYPVVEVHVHDIVTILVSAVAEQRAI
jgi:hypothetical protein